MIRRAKIFRTANALFAYTATDTRRDHNPVALLEFRNLLSNFLDNTCTIRTGNMRQRYVFFPFTAPEEYIEVVQRSGVKPNDHAIRGQRGPGNFFILKYTGLSKLMKLYSLH